MHQKVKLPYKTAAGIQSLDDRPSRNRRCCMHNLRIVVFILWFDLREGGKNTRHSPEVCNSIIKKMMKDIKKNFKGIKYKRKQ
jgi:hypothetical protein